MVVSTPAYPLISFAFATPNVSHPLVSALSNSPLQSPPSLSDVEVSPWDYIEGPGTPPVYVTFNNQFKGWYYVNNPNAQSITVILGMSLFVSGTNSPEYDDPAHDVTCTAPALTTSWCQRLFVPSTSTYPSMPQGSYDVVFAIWSQDMSIQYQSIRRANWAIVASSFDLSLSSTTTDGKSNVGSILVGSTTYSLPNTAQVQTTSFGVYAYPPSGYVVDHWTSSGRVSVSEVGGGSATVSVEGPGGITVVFKPGPDFSLSANPNALNVDPGKSVSTTVTATSNNGFSGSVSLSAGLSSGNPIPSWLSMTFATNPVSVSSGGSTSTILTLTVSGSAPGGPYGISVFGSYGGLGGIVRTSSVQLTVNTITPLSASATANPMTGQPPLIVQFTGSATGGVAPYSHFSWNFGDGASSSEQNPMHTYASLGTYTSTLTVTDSSGQTASSSITITVTQQPILQLSLSASSTTVTSGDSATIMATVTTSDGSSPSVSYAWSATGGSLSSASSNPVTWTAPAVTAQTTYTISVIASAQGYVSGSSSIDIVVQPTTTSSSVNVYALPIDFLGQDPASAVGSDLHASISVSYVLNGQSQSTTQITPFQVNADSGSQISFSVVSSPPGWNFACNWVQYGVQQQSTCDLSIQVVSPAEKIAAFFQQTTTTTSSSTTSSTTSSTSSTTTTSSTTILPTLLQVGITAKPLSGPSPLPVSFTSSVTGGIVPYYYNWDFGDGTSSSDANPTHVFTAAETYNVKLLVTDSNRPTSNAALASVTIAVSAGTGPGWEITKAGNAGTAFAEIDLRIYPSSVNNLKKLTNLLPYDAYTLLSQVNDYANDPNQQLKNPLYKLAYDVLNGVVESATGISPDQAKEIYLWMGAYSLFAAANLGVGLNADGSMNFVWHPTVVIIIMSHTDVFLTDSLGRHVGSDYQNGVFVRDINEIPGAFYSGHDTIPTALIVPPDTVISSLSVIGVSSGSYHLVAVGSGSQGVFMSQYDGSVSQNQVDNFNLPQKMSGTVSITPSNLNVFGISEIVLVAAALGGASGFVIYRTEFGKRGRRYIKNASRPKIIETTDAPGIIESTAELMKDEHETI